MAASSACAYGAEFDDDSDDPNTPLPDGSTPTSSSSGRGASSGANGGSSGESGSSGAQAGSSSSGSSSGAEPSSSSSSGSSSSSSSGSSSSSSGSSGSCVQLVINEVQIEGPNGAEDEFVEFYNKGTCDADFSQYKLVYRAASNNSGSAGFDGDLTVPAGGYAVVGTAKFTGSKQGTMTSGLSASTGGQLAIQLKSNNQKIDGIAWGSFSGGAFTEGTPAVKPSASQTLSRMPNGTDTNNNRDDFESRTPTPGAAN